MPRTTEPAVTYRPAVFATEEEAVAARASAKEALDELARAIARAAFERHYKELKETGRCRWMSLDPDVDWTKHDAEWVAWDAEQEKLRLDEVRHKRRSRKKLDQMGE